MLDLISQLIDNIKLYFYRKKLKKRLRLLKIYDEDFWEESSDRFL